MYKQVVLIISVLSDALLPVAVFAVCPHNTSSDCTNNVTNPKDNCHTGNCTQKQHHYYNRENKERGIAVGISCAILGGVLISIVVFMLQKSIRLARRQGFDNTSYNYREDGDIY